MARDTKPSEIELKRDDFSTPEQELCAERLQEHWNSNLTYKELEEQLYPDGPSQSLYRKVYNEYFGMPGDRRTFEQIRSEFGSVTNYLEERNAGNIQLEFEEDTELTKRELSLVQEGYKMAREELEDELDDEFDKGWDRALEMAEKMGVDVSQVPRMRGEDEEEPEEFSFPVRE